MVPAALRAVWPNTRSSAGRTAETSIPRRTVGSPSHSRSVRWRRARWSRPFRNLVRTTFVTSSRSTRIEFGCEPWYPRLGRAGNCVARCRTETSKRIFDRRQQTRGPHLRCGVRPRTRGAERGMDPYRHRPRCPSIVGARRECAPSPGYASWARSPPEQVRSEVLNGGYHAFINLSPIRGRLRGPSWKPMCWTACCGHGGRRHSRGGTPACNELVPASEPAPGVASAVLRAAQRPELQRRTRRQHWEDHYNERTTYARWSAELVSLAVRR